MTDSGRAPRRLLIIDDDPACRTTVGWLLRKLGHTVAEAESGSAGLALLRQQPVDLVLTDLTIRRGSAARTTEDVRSRARTGGTRQENVRPSTPRAKQGRSIVAKIALALAVASVLVGVSMGPALSDDHDRRDRQQGRNWRAHPSDQRTHRSYQRAPLPYGYYSPPVVYAPPPSPGISLFFDLSFRHRSRKPRGRRPCARPRSGGPGAGGQGGGRGPQQSTKEETMLRSMKRYAGGRRSRNHVAVLPMGT